MLKVEVEFASDAMVTNPADELSVMLGKLILRVQEDLEWSSLPLRDSNGNVVGSARMGVR